MTERGQQCARAGCPCHGFLGLVSEVMAVMAYAASGAPESRWRWQVDAILDKHTEILIGIDPPTQALQ